VYLLPPYVLADSLSTWLAERVRATVDDATTTGKIHADPASDRQLLERDAQSLRRSRRTVTSPCGPHQRVAVDGAEHVLLGFCSNDYLGLANHPALSTRRRGLALGGRQWRIAPDQRP
jgi:hypothetical protein